MDAFACCEHRVEAMFSLDLSESFGEDKMLLLRSNCAAATE
jgi:hypothetical protein